MRTRTKIIALAAAVIVVGAGTWWVVAGRPAQPTAANEVASLPTVAVAKGDLVATTQVPGVLGYAGNYSMVNQGTGTITALPSTGSVVSQGQTLYAVDQQPIPLLYGTVPLYRELAPGSEGADVKELEQNLVTLGFADSGALTVDEDYTWVTAQAVEQWQSQLGVPVTGRVQPGDAVTAPSALRINALDSVTGDPAQPGTVILSGTGTGHSAFVDLSLADLSSVQTDQVVSVTLPNGKPVNGTVKTIGTMSAPQGGNSRGTAQQTGGQPDACQGNTCLQTVSVEIAIDTDADLGGINEGPVTVSLNGEKREGVLTVPITALTVTGNGAFAVVLVDGTERRMVPVTTGLFASGSVEISGPDIAAGARVEVPAP